MSIADEFLADLGNTETEAKIDRDWEKMSSLMVAYGKSACLRTGRLIHVRHWIQYISEKNVSSHLTSGHTEITGQDLLLGLNTITRFIADILSEQQILHVYIRDNYKLRFPELEAILPNAVDYAKVILRIGFAQDVLTVHLDDLVSPQARMSIALMGANQMEKSGIDIDDLVPKGLFQACDELVETEKVRLELLQFVAQRMNAVSPNLTAIVGPQVAATLLGLAGGVEALSKMPASHVQVLGSDLSVRADLAGFSASKVIKHVGVIDECDLIRNCPASIQTQARRLVAAKCTLAARVDAYGDDDFVDRDRKVVGSLVEPALRKDDAGRAMKEDIEKKLAKLQEPPPAKDPKPLPAPEDKPSKHRGGRRKRKMKEKYGETEVRKQANRLQFGVEEEETFGLTGKGFGMLGKSSEFSHVRMSVQDRSKNAAKRQKKEANPSVAPKSGTLSQISGVATSLAFTSKQGFELGVPESAITPTDRHQRYFSAMAGFMQKPSN